MQRLLSRLSSILVLSRRTSASRTRLTYAQQRHHAPIMRSRRLDSRLQVERRQTDLRQHNRRRRRSQLRRWRCHRLRHKVPCVFWLHLRSFKHRCYIRRFVLKPSTALSHITSNLRRFFPKPSTAFSPITSNIRRSLQSSLITPPLPLPIPAVLIQQISHTLQTNIDIKPLPDRRRGIRKVSIRSLVEELEHPLRTSSAYSNFSIVVMNVK